MADQRNGGIAWCTETWNPLRGCTRVSAGCMNCYAESMAVRFAGPGQPYEGTINPETKRWNGTIKLVPEKLTDPLRWQRPRMVFVNSMSDLFHEDVPDEFIDQVFAVMAQASQHTFQVLTKRPERMRNYMIDGGMPRRVGSNNGFMANNNVVYPWPLPNVWVGVTVENQEAADERIPLLLQTPAEVRWLSMEPLLGSVDLSQWFEYIDHCNSYGAEHERGKVIVRESGADVCPSCGAENVTISTIGHAEAERYRTGERYEDSVAGRADIDGKNPSLDWIIVGGESGPHARPMHHDWARSLRDQCADAGVPFLFKQWGEWAPNWNNDDAGNKIAGSEWMDRQGKKVAGRLLDGVLHDGYPNGSKA